MNKEYIPKDLPECMLWYLDNTSKENLERFKNTLGDDIYIFHHTEGRNIRNSWGLWDENSELHNFFKSIGIWHADDMSSIIFTCLHRILNKKPCKIKEQIAQYKKYWKNINIKDGHCINYDC